MIRKSMTHNSMTHDFRIMSHTWNDTENSIFAIFGLERHHMITLGGMS